MQTRQIEALVQEEAKPIETLALNIATHGVLTPLIGYEATNNRIHITAGGRRLRALRWLIESERHPEWTGVTAVPVKLLSHDFAVDAGIAEQLTHRALSPLDQIKVFQRQTWLTDQEASQLFGISITFVGQRRAVLKLPDDILARVLNGEFTPEQGYGLTYWLDESEEAMAEAVEYVERRSPSLGDLRSFYANRVQPWSRQHFNDVVTQEAYLEAGGKLRGDLFTDDHFVEDPSIYRQCAKDGLRAKAEADFPGYGRYDLVEAALWDVRDQYMTWTPDERDPTEEEAAQLAEIEEAMEAIGDRMADEDTPYRYQWPDEAKAEYAQLEAEQEKIEDAIQWDNLTDEIKVHLGVVICMTERGAQELLRVIHDEHVPALIELGVLQAPDDEGDTEKADAEAISDEPDDPTAPVLSGPMRDRVRHVLMHVTRQVQIVKPDAVIGDYVVTLSDMFSHRFQSVRDNGWNTGTEYEGAKTSTQWDKALDIASLPPEILSTKKPADQRKALAARLLMCRTSPDEDLDAATIRQFFTPGSEWFNHYQKRELIHMAKQARPPSGHDYSHFKKAALVALLKAHCATKDGATFLPFGMPGTQHA